MIGRCRRIVFIGFVESSKENIRILFPQVLDSFGHGIIFNEVQCRKNLCTGIGTVNIQRTRKIQIHWFPYHRDPIQTYSEQLHCFLIQSFIFPESTNTLQIIPKTKLFRRPSPHCGKIVRDSVGRRNSTVLTSGMSTPSL